MKRAAIIIGLTLLGSTILQASTRSYYSFDGATSITEMSDDVSDSLLCVQFDYELGDTIPTGFQSSVSGLDQSYTPWNVMRGVWVFAVDTTYDIG